MEQKEKEKIMSIRIDAASKKVFDRICKDKDLSGSQVVRALVREYIKKNGQLDLFS